MRKNPPYLPVSPHHVHYQHTKGWKIILKTGYLPAFLPLFYSHLLLSGKTDSVVKDGLKAQKHIAQGSALGKYYVPTSPYALQGQKPNY
ncbi:MAG: hypothetical protein UDK33_03670 [Prevotella sp.]|nr:hypothetical protein [Prevotella sp.]